MSSVPKATSGAARRMAAGPGTGRRPQVRGRDKMQDRENLNYNERDSRSRSAAVWRAAGDAFEGRCRFGPTLSQFGAGSVLLQNPARSRATPSRWQNSMTQDFTAANWSGRHGGRIDFTRWSRSPWDRVEHTTGTYDAYELVSAGGVFTGTVNPTTGSTQYTDVLPGVHVNFFRIQTADDSGSLDQHARPARARESGANQRPRRDLRASRESSSAACRVATRRSSRTSR